MAKPSQVLAHSRPNSVDAKLQAAMTALDWPLLTRLCKQVLRKDRRHLMANRLLGFSLNKQRDTEGAVKAFQQAVVQFPNDAELHINYSATLLEHARNTDAYPHILKVTELRPDKAVSWSELAACCYALGLHEQGLKAADKAKELATTLHEQVSALTQRAIHRRELGEVKQAVEDCEEAIRLLPQDSASHTNRLLFMLADPATSAEQLARAGREYGEVFEPLLKLNWPSYSERQGQPWRRLRIGFISPDFRIHSVMYFLEGVLAQLDRRQFEVYAFYLYPKGDYVTERVERHADHFIRMSHLNSDERFNLVQSHQIDILIDLAGHTGHNGLLTLARKAAPVQATWVGFPGTTGLTAVDYLITDAHTDPPGVDALYTERLYRLDTRLCVYRPMSRNPLWRYQPRYLVQPAPAVANGFVTFGSCNNLGKITDQVLRGWGRILAQTPTARLLIEGKNFEQKVFAAQYTERARALGIDTARLELVPLANANQYLTYHRIDIALDPFPLNGGTTSMDVLWMGVPLVALEGQSFKSRLTTGILLHMGRREWLAQSEDDYVSIACSLAGDVEQLNRTRQALRSEVENSVVMREDLFSLHFGHALRNMWLRWQAEQEHPGDVAAQDALIAQWRALQPAEWNRLPVPGVSFEPGQRITVNEAHQVLEKALAKAKAVMPHAGKPASTQIDNPHWAKLTELSEMLLCAVPHDAVALSCLAEVEMAHGHTEFAVTYMRHAVDSMTRQAA